MSGDARPADALETGTIVFTDAHRPALQAGNYTLTVTQTVTHTIDTSWVRAATFHVRGERLTLDPGELLAVFPPRNAQGEFGNVLPHAVFARATLPWERSALSDGSSGGAAPWLALLVFDDGDATPPTKSVTMAELTAAGLDKTTLSYGNAGTGSSFKVETGEALTDACQVIDIPLDQFWAIAPSIEDLALLAHTRTVSAARKAGPSAADQTNAVVVANRLAAEPARPTVPAVVHLVSLEGLGHWLPKSDGSPPDVGTGQAATIIRLITLVSWKFTAIEPKESFVQYLANLDAAPLAMASKTGQQNVDDAAAAGYVGLPHTTRFGDQTVSWYRGPLAPGAVTAIPPGDPIMVADAAIGFDGATGMQNVSLAAAWQLGRAMMLAQRDTALALADWKREAARSLVVPALATARVSDLHLGLAAAEPGDKLSGHAIDLIVREHEHLR